MVYMKKIFYFLAVAVSATVTVLLSTAVILLGMTAFSGITQITIPEDTLYGMGGTLGVGAAGLLLWAFITRKKWQFMGEKETFHAGKALGYALFAVCVCKIIYGDISSRILSLCMPLAESDGAGTAEPLFLQICSGVLLAPLTEELLFRKDIYSLLVRKYSRITAILLTAAAFAAVHGYGIQGFLSCMLAGFLFTYFYDRTGCIWYSIFAHMLCNLEALASDLLSQSQAVLWGKPIIYSVNDYQMHHIVIFIMACVICILLVQRAVKSGNWQVFKRLKKSAGQ